MLDRFSRLECASNIIYIDVSLKHALNGMHTEN